jgi:hypothetical protein
MSNGGPKRSSIFTGLLLILIGAIFLLDRFDPLLGIGHLIRLFWPVLIIVWGVAKLIDHLAARREDGARPPFLSGGEAALMILLAFVLAGFVFRDWLRDHYPDFDLELYPFHQPYSQAKQLAPQTIPAGAHVAIETARGDIAIHATDGDELRVKANESASAGSESSAEERMKNVEIVIEQTGNGYTVHPIHESDFRGWVSVDLDVQLPKTSSVAARTNHGDINISGVAGSVDARTDSGDIEIHDAGSDVTVALQKGDGKITGVIGNLRVTGRGDDLEIDNVAGDATIEGAFAGNIRARNVAKTLRYTAPSSDLTVSHLTGSVEADTRDVAISNADGPVKLATHNKDIDVKNVAGRIDIINTHGNIKVSYSNPPHDELNITNDSGDVDVALPAKSNFEVSASSKSGEVESEFSDPFLKMTNEDDAGHINGKFGSLGPKITITTSYGTIHLRKSS